MTTDPTEIAAPRRDSPGDTGLRCPGCEYNLTGLTLPRCPECGATFDWEEVRRLAANRPTIAFERAGGWRKVPAFFVTWATVLFAPWVFARQAVARASIWQGLFFAVICFGPVTATYVWWWSGFEAYWAWVTTAAVYVLLQALLLTVVDPGGWRHPLTTFRFWAAVGGYTTAIVATECVGAAPLVAVGAILHCLQGFTEGRFVLADLYRLIESGCRWWGWIQIGLWLAALACCYWRRVRQRRISRPFTFLATLAVVLGLFVLYGFCVEVIGADFLYRFFDRFL